MFLFPFLIAVTPDQVFSSPDLAGATIATTVTDDQGNVLYERNGTLKVVPASNEKLFSAAFALYELGPDYRPVTRFWKEADRILVDAPGDPMMSYQDLVKASEFLNAKHLPVAVHPAYDPEFPGTWEIGDLPNRYAAPVSAFSVDQSGFELWDKDGGLELRPNRYGVKMVHSKSKSTGSFIYDPILRILKSNGTFPKSSQRLDTLAVPNATEAAASLIGNSVSISEDTPSGPDSFEITGKPLSEVLAFCLQNSDNNMAENLLLMAASRVGKLSVSDPYPEALRLLKDFEVRLVGLNSDDLYPRDGSGLTRSTLLTTRGVTSLLNWSAKQNTAMVWKNSLDSPSAGTLSHRLKGVNFRGKTGSLTHVAALSGYLVTKGSKNLTISVILNNFTCSESKARELIDRFVTVIFENGL